MARLAMKRAGMARALALGALALVATGAADRPPLPSYRVALDPASPMVAHFTLTLPSGRTAPLTIAPARGGSGAEVTPPTCAGAVLPEAEPPAGPKAWSVPPACSAVHWTARLHDHDRAGVDASLPASLWSAEGGFWFLAEGSGFLRPVGPDAGGIFTIAVGAGDEAQAATYDFPAFDQPPFYAVAGGTPSQIHEAAGARLLIYGRTPEMPWIDAVYGQILDTWAAWRRDVLPPDSTAPREVAFAWLQPSADAEPGFTASAGAGAIALQAKPRPDDPETDLKLRAAMTLLGAHEGFHTLIGASGQTWPAWVNESLANAFAYRAARQHLDAAHLVFLDRQVMAPAEISLQAAQEAYDQGDGAQGYVFYGKGARFWLAIEGVLVTRENPSGRLAALLQDTRNMKGLDWSSAEAIARFLDRYSEGRAGPIVRCYLVETGCAEPRLARVN